MGSFRRPKYEETAADKAVREDIERRRAEELEEQRKNEEAPKNFEQTGDDLFSGNSELQPVSFE